MGNESQNYKKPNALIYSIFALGCKILSFFKFNLKIKENHTKKVKGSYVVIANHESALDFVNIARALNRRAHFVISNAFYKTFPMGSIVKKLGLIPKNQFQTMPSDLKKMKQVTENGLPLVIFPAGLMPENGIGTPIPKATGKALKWLGCDVYLAYSEGSYLTNPKWSKKWRKGQTTLSVTKFISKEELLDISSDELQEKVEKSLYFEAYKNNKSAGIAFKNGDNVEGLEKVLYRCPECNKKYTVISENKNTLKCTNCGYKVYSDKYGELHKFDGSEPVFKYPSDWSLYIESKIKEEIVKNSDFKLESKADVYTINDKKHKFVLSGSVNVSLSREGLVLKGVVCGEDIYKIYSVKNYPSLPLKPGKSFEIQDGKTIYRIYPEDPSVCTEWVSTVEILYEM